MTRNGKIARLPKAVRHELNCRLSEGEPGASLVEWHNERDDVKKVLAASFGGRPVSEQNLSESRARGDLDWQRHQETLELAQRMNALRTTGKKRINTPKHGITRDNTGEPAQARPKNTRQGLRLSRWRRDRREGSGVL
jgi:hypothetical protein